MLVAPRAASVWPFKSSRAHFLPIPLAEPTALAGSQAPSASFPRSVRLLKPAQYQAVLRRGRRLARGALFQVLGAQSAESPAPQGARLGLIVGKRNAPLAVSRNAIKRVWREAFRACRAQLPPGDFVVRLQARVPAVSLTVLKGQVAAEAQRLLLQAARQHGGKAVPVATQIPTKAVPGDSGRASQSPRDGA